MTAARGLRQRVVRTSGFTRAGVAFAAGSVSVLAMAPFFAGPVLFLTLPVLFWLIESGTGDLRARSLGAARDGWWFGFGYFLFGLYWIGHAFLVEADTFAWLLPFAVTILPAGLALFYALAAGAAAYCSRGGALARLLVFAVAMALAEYARGHVLTGFPWNTLGLALTGPLVLMQGAGLVGTYGLTLWVIVIACGPLVVLADQRSPSDAGRALALAAGLAVVPLGLLLAWGALALAEGASPTVPGVRLRLVQPSVPQRDKWRPERQREFFFDHIDLSRRDAAGVDDDLRGVTHVIWPEASMPFRPLESAEALAALGGLLPPGVPLIAGALRYGRPIGGSGEHPPEAQPGEARAAYNSIMVFGDGGRLTGLYDKIHLVPFGEYLPFQASLEAIGLESLTRVRGGFATGPRPRPLLKVDGLPPIAPLICYEAAFPGAVIQGSERPGLILNVTNDGWFGHSTGPYQHLHLARLRAVEEGLPMLRSANNGISAVIDGRGRVLASLGLDVRGVIDSTLPAALSAPPYALFGDSIFALNVAFMAYAAFALARGKGSGTKPSQGLP